MEPELFGPTTPISAQHFCKGSQRGARAAINEKLRIINQFSGAFLEFIHQRILFIRIERFVEATQIQQSLAARNEIAKNEFLLAALTPLTHRGITRATGAKRQPASQH